MFTEFKNLLYTLQRRHGRYRVRGEYYPENNLLVLFYDDFVILKGSPNFFKRISQDQLLNQAERQIGAIKRAVFRDIKSAKVGGWKHGLNI